MIVRDLSALMVERSLTEALEEAQARLAAAPPGEELWLLPGGTHMLTAAVSLGSEKHALTLRGRDATELKLSGGTFSLRGSAVALEALLFMVDEVASGVELSAGRATLSSVGLGGRSSGAVAGLTVNAGEGLVLITGLRVDGLTGAEVQAVKITAGELRVAGVEARQVRATAGNLGVFEALCQRAQLADLRFEELVAASSLQGLRVSAVDRIDATGVLVASARGKAVEGVRLLSSRAGSAGVSVVDCAVSELAAASSALGLVAGTGGPLRMSGFTVSGVVGGATTGLLALAGRGLEVAMGRIKGVIGSGSAVGARILASSSKEPVLIRDVAVSRVGGPVPGDARPTEAWRDWVESAVTELANAPKVALALPSLPQTAEAVGVHVSAPVSEFDPLLDMEGPGEVVVEDCSLRTISGTALQLLAGPRAAEVRRTEAWASVRAGWLQSAQLLLAQLTWHQHAHGLRLGPGEIFAYDSIFSAVGTGPFLSDTDADLTAAQALFAQGASAPFLELGALPYREPGPPDVLVPLKVGSLPAPAQADFRLLPGAAVARSPVPIPGDGDDAPPPFVGAWELEQERGCELRDPQPRPYLAAPPPPAAGTLVDYRARDAKTLLAVMVERARVVMPSWTDRGPADFTTMLMETVAAQLDHLAYRQERAVTEGFLADARLRRSVEDHARSLDYWPDPGLSATTMVRFRVDPDVLAARVAVRLEELNLPSVPAGTEPLELINGNQALEIPAGTLVANATDLDQLVAFSTEAPLSYLPRLDTVELHETVDTGDTSAMLSGRFPELEEDRWLVLTLGPGQPSHVVRVTELQRSTDTTRILWDPRRPAPCAFPGKDNPDPKARARVLGNVVPAHHGLPLAPLPPSAPQAAGTMAAGPSAQPEDFDRLLIQWRELLAPIVDGTQQEIRLPFHPVSVQALGYPLPGEEATRTGTPRLRVSVEDDVWTRVDDLSVQGPGDEVVVLRSSPAGGQSLRFGDGVHGSALPARWTRRAMALSVGLGQVGNVGEDTLTRLLRVAREGDRGAPTGGILAGMMEEIRQLLRVNNPLPAIGGCEPEPLHRIRYRAPMSVSQPLSAITADDYVKLLEQLPEVAGASARIIRRDLRTVVNVTVLLRDVDTLGREEMLRRWALVRRRLEEIRLLGFDVEAVPPTWVPLDLDLHVDAAPYAQADLLKDAVIAAVAGQNGLLDPDQGGLGGDVQLADLYQAVLDVPGVTAVRVKRFRKLKPQAPELLSEGVIPIGPEEVATVAGGLRPGSQGLLTVTVHGGLR